MENIILRRFEEKDRQAVYNLHIEALKHAGVLISDPGLRKGFDKDLENIEETYLKEGEFLVATIDNEIVGMGALRKIDETTAEIKRMRTKPELQGRGIGKLILDNLIERAKKLGYKKLILGVAEKQKVAQHLYESRGFTIYKTGQLGGQETRWYQRDIQEKFSEKSIGVIPITLDEGGNIICLAVQHADGHWGVPKGKPELGEDHKKTARRELFEETGLSIREFLREPAFTETYTFERDGKTIHKEVIYYLALLEKINPSIPQEFQDEILQAVWVPFDDLINLAQYEDAKAFIRSIVAYIQENEGELKNMLLSKEKIPENLIQYFIGWAKEIVGTDASAERASHGDEGAVFKITSEKGNYYLKIGKSSSSSKEIDRLAWLKDKLPVPHVVDSTEKDEQGAMLLTALEGKNLADLCKEWPAEKIINKLVEALHQFHDTNAEGWPFKKLDSGTVLVHGDACLPNFIFNGDSFSGYIDLASTKVASPEVDLAAAVWSLQYNLGPGYGKMLLEKYGYQDTSEEAIERLRKLYEDYQQEHGFL